MLNTWSTMVVIWLRYLYFGAAIQVFVPEQVKKPGGASRSRP